MLRGALAIVIGAIVWMAVFYALAIGLANAWPDYAAHGRVWFENGVYGFRAEMSAANLAFWIVAEVAAGWVAVAIARRSSGAWLLAAVLAAYMCAVHLYFYWPTFPWWYNLAVALSAAPAVLIGGRLARRFVRA